MRDMKRLSVVALFTALAVGTYPAFAGLWDAAGFEASPADSDPVSQGDDKFRELKKEDRFRNEVEHHFGDDNSDDNGEHRVGSGRCFVQALAPTAIQRADYNPTVGTSGSGSSTLTTNATLNTDVPVLKIGHGRCWIDTNGADGVEGNSDDNKLWLFDQDPNGDGNTADAGWVAARVDDDITAEETQARFDFKTSTSNDETLIDNDTTTATLTVPSTGTWRVDVAGYVHGLIFHNGNDNCDAGVIANLNENFNSGGMTQVASSVLGFNENGAQLDQNRQVAGAIPVLYQRTVANGDTLVYQLNPVLVETGVGCGSTVTDTNADGTAGINRKHTLRVELMQVP